MMVAIHSADFIRRRATGEAHIVPGSHAFRSSRCTTTKPKPRASPVPTTKYGRNGSNVVARPAPLRPRATAMSGPAQQSADATAAAIPPVAATTVLVDCVARVLAVAGRRASRGREQASPLVVTDRLDVHVGRCGDLADGQWHILHPPRQCLCYTMYLGTWSRGRQSCPNDDIATPMAQLVYWKRQ